MTQDDKTDPTSLELEMDKLGVMVRSLLALDQEARRRVMRYLNDCFTCGHHRNEDQ